MKKLMITTLALLTCGAVYALPVGNPTEASLFQNGVRCDSTYRCEPCDPCFSWCDAWSLRLGFYGDYVFNRHLEGDVRDTDRDINVTKLNTNAGYLALNIFDWVDLFATLGVTRIAFRADGKALGVSSVLGLDSEVHYQSEFSWSVGGRATIWEWGCFGFGLEGQYFQTKPDLDYTVFYNTGEFFYFNDAEATYKEWQVGLGASYQMKTWCPTFAFVPYVAVKWAGAKLDSDDALVVEGSPFFIPNLESKKLWGYAVGVTFTICEMAGVTVEGRFADEKALYVNGQLRF